MSSNVVSESSEFATIEEEFAVDDDLVEDENVSTEGIEWSDPPKHRGGGRKANEQFVPIAQALKENKGKWAKIVDGSRNTSLVAQIKQGKIAAFEPEGSFEATGRRSEDGDLAVWARFVGE